MQTRIQSFPYKFHNFQKVRETLLWWIEGDKDITAHDEWHYIYITFKELVEVIRTKNK